MPGAAIAVAAGPPPRSARRTSPAGCRFGPSRRLAVVRFPLGELEQTGHALGVTVNDLVLAAVTGGLQRLLTARGYNAPGMRQRCSVPAAIGWPGFSD